MTSDRPRVLVTGTSGFIGRHVAPVLVRGGWLVRRGASAHGFNDEVMIESQSGATDWRVALEGVDAVVHLATRVHQRNEGTKFDLYRDVNVEGTSIWRARRAATDPMAFLPIQREPLHGIPCLGFACRRNWYRISA